MRFHLDHTNVVVIAQQHNPTILHPTFLSAQAVVPSAFVVDEEQVLCSPAVSHVRYRNSIDITAQTDRVQFAAQADEAIRNELEPSVIVNIAKRYVTVLEHVRYVAVGLNFFGVIRHADPEAFMRDFVISEGPWKHFRRKLKNAEAHMYYELMDGTLRIALSAVHRADDPAQTGIGVDANYHMNLAAPTSAEAVSKLDKYDEAFKDYLEIANHVVEKEPAK